MTSPDAANGNRGHDRRGTGPGTSAGAGSGAPSATATPLTTRVSALLRDVGSLARDHLELAVLEAQRAGIGLTRVLIAAVVISVLVITAWLSFVAGFIVWITDQGVNWPAALAIGGVVNLLLAGAAMLWMRKQKDAFTFEATLRQIRRTAADAKELA